MIWTGGLPHLSGLPHVPGVPHLHVNRPLGSTRSHRDLAKCRRVLGDISFISPKCLSSRRDLVAISEKLQLSPSSWQDLFGRMEKPESGIRNRKRKRNRNRNPNLRNKTWRRFCLKGVTNSYCSIKTFHPHIIFIYCYYIFYCRIFCARRKIFLREFHIRVSVATWDHD